MNIRSDSGRYESWSELLPGTTLSEHSRIQCKSLLLIYGGLLLSKTPFRDWINEVAINILSTTIDNMRISHKKHRVGTELHKDTYVIIVLSSTTRGRRSNIFYYSEIQPEIRTLKNQSQVRQAIQYLDNWNSESQPKRIVSIEKSIPKNNNISDEDRNILEQERIALEKEKNALREERIAFEKMRDIFNQERITFENEKNAIVRSRSSPVSIVRSSNTPLEYYITDFVGWQVQLHRMMKKNEPAVVITERSEALSFYKYNMKNKKMPYPELVEGIGKINRCIQVIYLDDGKTGSTVFLRAIKFPTIGPNAHPMQVMISAHNPNRFLVITGIPNYVEFLEICNLEKESGWTEGCIIFDISHLDTIDDNLYKTLDEACDRYGCRSVWLFTKRIPGVGRMSVDRWIFYSISMNRTHGLMSELLPMTYSTVKDILSKQSQ